jgi:hypothetical protein
MGSAAKAVGAKLAKANANNHIRASSERDAARRAAAALAPDPVLGVVDGSIELFRLRKEDTRHDYD